MERTDWLVIKSVKDRGARYGLIVRARQIAVLHLEFAATSKLQYFKVLSFIKQKWQRSNC